MLKTRSVLLRAFVLVVCSASGVGFFTPSESLAENVATISLEGSPNIIPVHITGGKVESVRSGGFFRTLTFVVDAAFYFPCNVPQSEDEIAWRFIARDAEKRDIYEISQIRRPDAETCMPVREPIMVKLKSKGVPFVRLTAPSAFIVNAHEIPVEF